MAPPKPLFTSLPGAHTATPRPRSLGESLEGHDVLAGLLARVRASQARLDALAEVLPEILRPHLRAGPLDDESWTLLAANAAVAAKLRQLLPTLCETLAAKGWQATAIRVKVQSTQARSG
jgi:hypothetical protein